MGWGVNQIEKYIFGGSKTIGFDDRFEMEKQHGGISIKYWMILEPEEILVNLGKSVFESLKSFEILEA